MKTAVNPPQPIVVDGVEYLSRLQAEQALGMSSGTIAKKTRCRKLPATVTYRGKQYEISRP